ncbi:hypothetical protein OsI_30548 [Oryza sativa Indica Group]|uniref:Uncharacterized protein n=1 Tax=Oryza sativa subsp. indica TaxID=39946 RepID=A2YYY5_ORYSI|nr:hypothetical protein OsI_30548 [Oryza sativa Indica Group]
MAQFVKSVACAPGVVFLNSGDRSDSGEGRNIGAGGEIAGVEVERRGAPDRAPPFGEGSGLTAVLAREERDDDAKNGVREVADEVDALLAAVSSNSEWRRYMAAPPSAPRGQRQRRLAWWCCFIRDRVVALRPFPSSW